MLKRSQLWTQPSTFSAELMAKVMQDRTIHNSAASDLYPNCAEPTALSKRPRKAFLNLVILMCHQHVFNHTDGVQVNFLSQVFLP